MSKYYGVVLKHWTDGSGFSWEEDFDTLDEECTAEEYIDSLYPDTPFNLPDNEDRLVQIVDDEGKVLSEAWAKEIEDGYKEDYPEYFED